MSIVDEFRKAMNENEDWQEEIRSFGDDDNVVKFANDKGYDFTEDEYKEYVENMGDELTSFEMELVSGGNDCGGGVNDLLT